LLLLRLESMCFLALAHLAHFILFFNFFKSFLSRLSLSSALTFFSPAEALSFMMEYIQQMAGDYINAVTPLIEDALIDRDAVHRQTACTIVKHMAVGVHGLGCEDCLVHLLNFVFPNVFETSPHVIGAVLDAVEGISLAIGPARVLNFALPGLFHPARKVRAVYWKIYNHLYYNFQDKMVACFPSIPDEPPERHYQRSVLDIMI
jgi:splicing factor 3B subunit 1